MKALLRTLAIFIAMMTCLSPAAFGQSKQSLTVSAAISLKDSFQAIGKAFEAKHPAVKVQFNFGSSGSLKTQILAGAPVDVYASAAMKEMDELESQGKIIKATRRTFAENSVVLIQPKDAPVTIKDINGLKNDAVKKIALGNPKTVPAGRYAQETLASLRLYALLKEKYVFAENVRQVLDYVSRGEVDAGFVYATDAAMVRDTVTIVCAAPPESHKPVQYPIAVIAGSTKRDAGELFAGFVASADGRKILKRYGFTPVGKK